LGRLRFLLRLSERLLSASRFARVAMALGVLLICALGVSEAAGKAGTEGGCSWVEPLVTQAWSQSAVQTADGSALVMTDSAAERLLVMPLAGPGGNLVPLSGAVGRTVDRAWPSSVARQGDALLVHLEVGSRLLRIGAGLRAVGESPLSELTTRGEESLQGLFLWDVTASGDLIACGDLKRGENWDSGFYRLPAGGGDIVELLGYGPTDPLNIFCRLGLDLIATIGDTAYFVVMEQPPRIYRHAPGDPVALPLASFPPHASAAPGLAPLPPREEFAALLLDVENSDMVVGLYADDELLYALHRDHTAAGVDWLLVKIDPQTDEVVGTLRVPSGANHLMVAPGPEEWVFIEKGPVKSLGDQTLAGILRVPTAEIDARHDGTLCQ